MSDWSDNLARERREEEEKVQLAKELLLSNRRKVEQNAEAEWQVVRKRIYELVDELNASWGSNAINVANVTSHECSISVADRSVGISFIARDHKLSVPFYGPSFYLKVDGNDRLIWQSEAESSKRLSSDQVARRTVEFAWRGKNI